MSAVRLLVSGDRRFSDRQVIRDALEATASLLAPFEAPLVLVHGAARGLDALAAEEAADNGWLTEAHPAKWSEHTAACPPAHANEATCRMAGHRRNAEMLQPLPNVLIAFPLHVRTLAPGEDRHETSRGTWSMVDKALTAKVPTLVVWCRRLFPADLASMAMLTGHTAPDMRPDGSVSLDSMLRPL